MKVTAGSGSRAGRVVLATLIHAVLVLGPLSGYLVYQRGHAQRVEAAHFRAVAALAAETTQRLHHLRHLFTYAAGKSAGGSEAWLANARLSDAPISVPAPDGVAAAGLEAPGAGCGAQAVSFALEPGGRGTDVRLDRPACASGQAWCACPPLPWPATGTPAAAPQLCEAPGTAGLVAAFDRELAAQLQRYERAGMLAPATGTDPQERCAAGAGLRGLTGAGEVAASLAGARSLRVPLADLLPPLAPDDRFRALVLMRADGTVLHATDPTWPPRLELAPAGAGADGAPATAATPAGGALAGGWFTAALPVRRAGQDEVLFCVPLAVPYADAPVLALCASTPRAALARASRALAPDLLALAVLVFLLSVCAVPLLKVWLIGPQEAYRRADLAAAVAGVLAGAALITVLMAWAGWTLAWRARLDDAARELGVQVRSAFGDELKQSAAVLAQLSAPGADVPALTAALPGWARLAFRLDSAGRQVGPLGTAAGLGALAAPADVANRLYFQAARAGQGVPLGKGGPLAGVEQVVMRGHGVKATALAVPVPGDPKRVAVLLRAFASLDAPLLPRGFTLVVFDARTGQVQLHSDPGRALAENFYGELGHSGLAARLRDGKALWLSAEYAGGPQRFRLVPLHPDWPWWLAVGREEGLWRAAGFDIVAGALPVLGVIVSLLVAGGVTLGYAFGHLGRGAPRSQVLAWLWPQWGRRYGWRAAVLGVCAGLGLVALVRLDPPAALGAVLVLAVVGSGVFAQVVRGAPRPAATPPGLGYLACVALLVVLGGVLPAAAVVRDLGAWVESGYQRLVLRDYARADAAQPGPGRYLPGSILFPAPPQDVPAAAVPVPGPWGTHPGARVLTAGVTPDLADVHVAALRQAAATAPRNERADAQRRCQPVGEPDGPWVCAPRMAGFWPGGEAGALLAVLGALLVWAGVRLLGGAAERVFGLGMGSGRLPGLADDGVEFPAHGHVLVVRAPGAYVPRLARALGSGPPALRVRCVDLRAAETDAAGRPQWPAALATSNDVVILAEFDARPADPVWSLARLELLEKLLLRPGPRVVVCSDMSDPARVALDLADPAQAEALAARWAGVLRELALLRYPLPPSPTGGQGPALDLLERETAWTWRLDAVARALHAQDGFGALPLPAAQAEINARAWPHYRHLWSLCTGAERLALAQLAHGAQLNPRQSTVVTQLLRRGLVRRAPEFRLAGEGFAEFVRDTLGADAVRALEQAGSGGAWQTWRAPLLVAVLVGGALLFVTQRDTFQAAYALAAAALAAVPVLIRMAQAVRGAGGVLGAPAPAREA